ncbi:hypothetical protein PM082_022080 [Marasmius tenuissimus]|nr:hypothetical protein PM082_022080 [Marasmius tenuissimus]
MSGGIPGMIQLKERDSSKRGAASVEPDHGLKTPSDPAFLVRLRSTASSENYESNGETPKFMNGRRIYPQADGALVNFLETRRPRFSSPGRRRRGIKTGPLVVYDNAYAPLKMRNGTGQRAWLGGLGGE